MCVSNKGDPKRKQVKIFGMAQKGKQAMLNWMKGVYVWRKKSWLLQYFIQLLPLTETNQK